jgi:hypothetical protein
MKGNSAQNVEGCHVNLSLDKGGILMPEAWYLIYPLGQQCQFRFMARNPARFILGIEPPPSDQRECDFA